MIGRNIAAAKGVSLPVAAVARTSGTCGTSRDTISSIGIFFQYDRRFSAYSA
jgi:hypothetical protein